MRPVRAIRRFVSLAAIAAVALSFSIGSASGAASSIQEAAQQADTVFVGIADPAHGAKTSFEVLVAYKGTPGLVIDHGCLKPFVAGKTYTVFASERNGVLQSDCAFTQEGVVPPTKILTAGRGGKAAGASPKPSAPESSSGSSFFAGPVFWALFLIAAALAIPVYLLFRLGCGDAEPKPVSSF